MSKKIDSNLKNDLIYGPRKTSAKTFAIFIFMLVVGVFFLWSGLKLYVGTSDDQTFQQLKAVKNIIVGGLVTFFVVLVLFVEIMKVLRGCPRLILSANGVRSEGIWGASCYSSAEWNSLSPFEISILVPKGKLKHLVSKITGSHIAGNAKPNGTFIITPSILNADASSLLQELNQRRALCL